MRSRDHDQLPLTVDGASLLDGPFTPAMARAAGVGRGALDRLLAEGRVRRLLRGVYLATTVGEDAEVRAAAVALVVPADAVVVDRTAAWVHGIDVPAPVVDALPPVEVLRRGARSGRARALAAHDVLPLGGILVSTPLRTAMDLGRRLAPALAQGTVDAVLRLGLCTHRELLAELPRFGGHEGVVQLRHVVALADARAADAAESALRLHWFAARLPTPVPALTVEPAGLRLALGLPVQRFGAVVGTVQPESLAVAESLGWRVVAVSASRLLHRDPEPVLRHVEVEYHRQLLREVS